MSTESPSTTSSEMAAEYVNPVIMATKSVFETMLGVTPQRTGLSLKETTSPQYELSAVIGFTGKAAGTIVVSFSREAALGVLERMIGIVATELDDEVTDAIGEVTNMIAGSAKAQMERLQLRLSIPNIISGEGHKVVYPSNVKPMLLDFDSEIGKFSIEVGFSGI